MPRRLRLLLVSAVVVAGVWTCLASVRTTAVARQPAAGIVYNPAGLKYMGTGRCGGMPCHDMNLPPGQKFTEYKVWLKDPHGSKSYTVLYDERSKLIEKNLKKLPRTKDAKPEEDVLCLKCHAMASVPETLRNPKMFNPAEGIGCEICHGPAEKWLEPHQQGNWKNRSLAQKAALGMRPTKDLWHRAQLCTECHVGTGDREVNHDLIAAGHPRLYFEFGSFHGNYSPKHWTEQGDNRAADFEARVWAVGQVVSAQAAVELLEARAKAAARGPDLKLPPGTRPVWPEFSEYDCFACHHALRDEKWRREVDFSRRRPGSYPWNTYYQALLPLLAERLPGAQSKTAVQAVGELTTLMSHVRPDSEKVAATAAAARPALLAWGQALDEQHFKPAQVDQLLRAVVADPGKLAGTSWDASAQLYNAVYALHLAQAAAGKKNPKLTATLDLLYSKAMQFPKGYDSPVGFNADLFREQWAKVPGLLK